MPQHPSPSNSVFSNIVAVNDYEAVARTRLNEQAWAYLSGGVADELTLQDNCHAFGRLRLQNRLFADIKTGNTQCRLFGQTLDYPILLAPVAHQKLAHADAELATVTGASAMKAAMIVSTLSSMTLEAIAQAAQTPLWFQLYFQSDREYTLHLLRRAETAGYGAIVVTADVPITGMRNREQRAGFALPANMAAANLSGPSAAGPRYGQAQAGPSPIFGSGALATAPTWTDLEWLRSQTRLPVLLKGVTSPEDARLAITAGIDGLIVSNHGGRALDTQPASIDALPAVADRVGGQVPILLDGGIRRGTDILKALALGATAVLVGRPYIYGLAAVGAVGVAHVLHILRTELEMAMALTGCSSLADINAKVLWQGPVAP